MKSPGTPRLESWRKQSGIEEVVVHAAIDYVDALQASGGPHVDDVVVHQEIAAFDEFDSHLLGKKCVLEIRGVENSGRQQDDLRFVPRPRTGRGERPQRGQQCLRVVIDRAYSVVAEKRREDFLQHFAVRQHVGDAAGHAQIVFEHGEAAVGQTDQVGAADADVDSARNGEPAHFAAEVTATVHQFARDDAIREDSAVVIDVFQE